MPVGTPQLIAPACFTLSSVGPAEAGTAKPSAAARPAASAAIPHVLGIRAPWLPPRGLGRAVLVDYRDASTAARRPATRSPASLGPNLGGAADLGDVPF